MPILISWPLRTGPGNPVRPFGPSMPIGPIFPSSPETKKKSRKLLTYS